MPAEDVTATVVEVMVTKMVVAMAASLVVGAAAMTGMEMMEMAVEIKATVASKGEEEAVGRERGLLADLKVGAGWLEGCGAGMGPAVAASEEVSSAGMGMAVEGKVAVALEALEVAVEAVVSALKDCATATPQMSRGRQAVAE